MRAGHRSRPTCSVDHYRVLELNRYASDADIKRAYRRMARRWHPDVNQSPHAPTVFSQVLEAFETLSDRIKRAAYDSHLYPNIKDTQYSSHQESPSLRDDLRATLTITLAEAVIGTDRDLLLPVLQQCPACRGSGGREGSSFDQCEICRGLGDFIKTTTTPTGRSSIVTCCPACCGKGVKVLDCCPTCSGSGLTRLPKSIKVSIPAGTEDGAVVRLSGQGHSAENGRLPGDVVLRVIVHPDGAIKRHGMDLHSVVYVPLWIAVLGGSVAVPTLRGGERDLRIPTGTQDGTRVTVPGEGVLGKGSFHFTVRIAVPTSVSPEESHILQQLSELRSSGTHAQGICN